VVLTHDELNARPAPADEAEHPECDLDRRGGLGRDRERRAGCALELEEIEPEWIIGIRRQLPVTSTMPAATAIRVTVANGFAPGELSGLWATVPAI
jgi:hypothetical protein